MSTNRFQQWAAGLGLTGVMLGAFGAHAMEARLTDMDRVDTWETAVFYHLTHAIVLLVISRMPHPPRWSAYAMITGILIFSGSLYMLCLTGITQLGAITPIGGLALMTGWLALFMPPKKA
jgi:uncharacterized membrane protein YgdD (TMEM256/DUF423 family)